MTSLINPLGIKTFSGLQMHWPDPRLGQGRGIAFKDGDRGVKTGLSARKKGVDTIELHDDFFVSQMDFYTTRCRRREPAGLAHR